MKSTNIVSLIFSCILKGSLSPFSGQIGDTWNILCYFCRVMLTDKLFASASEDSILSLLFPSLHCISLTGGPEFSQLTACPLPTGNVRTTFSFKCSCFYKPANGTFQFPVKWHLFPKFFHWFNYLYYCFSFEDLTPEILLFMES